MKKLLATTLLLATFSAQANLGATSSGTTISWPDTGGWMEIQNAATWQMVCDGFISSCDAGVGTFNIIDHSNSGRQNGVTVTGLGANPVQASGSEVVSEYCNFQSAGLGYKHRCTVTCPAGKVVVAVLSCYWAKEHADGNQLASGFITRGNYTKCEADGGGYTAGGEVSVMCQ